MKAYIGKRYKHYKGGEYTVLTIARNEANPSESFVIYRAEYDAPDMGYGAVWARVQSNFEEKVVVQGKETERFTCIDT